MSINMLRVVYTVVLLTTTCIMGQSDMTPEESSEASNEAWYIPNNVKDPSELTDPSQLTGVYTISYYADEECAGTPEAVKTLPASGYNYNTPEVPQMTCLENLYCFVNPEGEGCISGGAGNPSYLLNSETEYNFVYPVEGEPGNYTMDGFVPYDDTVETCYQTSVYHKTCWYRVRPFPV